MNEGAGLRFKARGPKDTRAVVRVQPANKKLPEDVSFDISFKPPLPVNHVWDAVDSMLSPTFDNIAEEVSVIVEPRG